MSTLAARCAELEVENACLYKLLSAQDRADGDTSAARNELAVIGVLKNDSALTSTQIALRTSIPRRTVDATIERLRAADVVACVGVRGGRMWSLT